MMASRRCEIPPTAGLPLEWRDFCAKPRSLAATLASLLSIPPPIMTCSGTAALVMALRTLQQRSPGRSQLIVPAYTCPLVALAAHFCPGLKVIPCDLLPNSIDLCPQQLASLCNEQTLAVVVTHLAGRVADTDTALAMAKAVGAAVIEDAAQSLGARDGEESLGLKGDIGFFSLAIGKGLTSAEGGVLFSRDAILHQQLVAQCASGLPTNMRWEITRTMQLFGYKLFYRPDRLFWVYGRGLRRALARSDAVAAVGDDFSIADIPLHRLGAKRQRVAAAAAVRLPAYLAEGTLRAQRRLAQLSQLPGVQVLTDAPGQQGVWPFLMVMMPSQHTRDNAMQQLWTSGLGVTRLFINTLPDYPDVTPLLGDALSLSNAQDFANRTLSVSNSHWLTDDMFSSILNVLRQSLLNASSD